MLKNIFITASLVSSLLCASEGERQEVGDSPKASRQFSHEEEINLSKQGAIGENIPLMSLERFSELLE